MKQCFDDQSNTKLYLKEPTSGLDCEVNSGFYILGNYEVKIDV